MPQSNTVSKSVHVGEPNFHPWQDRFSVVVLDRALDTSLRIKGKVLIVNRALFRGCLRGSLVDVVEAEQLTDCLRHKYNTNKGCTTTRVANALLLAKYAAMLTTNRLMSFTTGASLCNDSHMATIALAQPHMHGLCSFFHLRRRL